MPGIDWQLVIISLSALLFGGFGTLWILQNPKTREAGIGDHTLQALSLAIAGPIVLILGIAKVLSPETIAALIGALVGYAVPKGKS